MEACGNEIEKYFSLAVEFHQQLALATKNKIFFLIWEMFHDILLKGYLPILREIFSQGPTKLLEANKVLLEAIKARDPGCIDEAMKMHVEKEKFFPPHPYDAPGK